LPDSETGLAEQNSRGNVSPVVFSGFLFVAPQDGVAFIPLLDHAEKAFKLLIFFRRELGLLEIQLALGD
jgi:hypothetical protein